MLSSGSCVNTPRVCQLLHVAFSKPRIFYFHTDIDDPQSLQRKLMDKLVLLVKCKVGDKSMWMMPQGARQEGETMREVCFHYTILS